MTRHHRPTTTGAATSTHGWRSSSDGAVPMTRHSSPPDLLLANRVDSHNVRRMGAQLGRYTVLRHLASGGMADVLLARADGIEGFERHVVIKRILPQFAGDERFIHMFLDEARVAATLHHQNIVHVHDIGEADGEYFLAMEYVHGEDARKVLARAAK